MAGGPWGRRGPAHLDVQVQLLPEVVVQGGHLALQALVLGGAIRQGLGREKMGGLGGLWQLSPLAGSSPGQQSVGAPGKARGRCTQDNPPSRGGGGSRGVQAVPCPSRAVPVGVPGAESTPGTAVRGSQRQKQEPRQLWEWVPAWHHEG